MTASGSRRPTLLVITTARDSLTVKQPEASPSSAAIWHGAILAEVASGLKARAEVTDCSAVNWASLTHFWIFYELGPDMTASRTVAHAGSAQHLPLAKRPRTPRSSHRGFLNAYLIGGGSASFLLLPS